MLIRDRRQHCFAEYLRSQGFYVQLLQLTDADEFVPCPETHIHFNKETTVLSFFCRRFGYLGLRCPETP